MLWTVLTVAPGLLTSCASSAAGIRPPVTVAPQLGADIDAWINTLMGGYMDNCVTLKTIRAEDPSVCRQP